MVTATDEPGGSEVLATRTKRLLVAYAAAAVVLIASMAGVFVLVTRHDRCAAMRQELAQIERDNTLDAAQAWDDIYELQEALARRNELQAELRTGGCN